MVTQTEIWTNLQKKSRKLLNALKRSFAEHKEHEKQTQEIEKKAKDAEEQILQLKEEQKVAESKRAKEEAILNKEIDRAKDRYKHIPIPMIYIDRHTNTNSNV